MKRFLSILVFLAICVIQSHAAVNEYTFSSSTGTYTEVTGATVLSTEGDDDETYTDAAIGFSFTFDNVVYTTVSPCSNGYLFFGSETETSYYTTILSSTSVYQPVVSPFSRDLIVREGLNASVSIVTTGTAPNRVCTIQWKNISILSASVNNGDLNYQIKLYETSNIIQMIYGNCSTYTSTYTPIADGQVGIRGLSNTDYLNRTGTSWATSVSGTTNSATLPISSTVYPASGTIFQYEKLAIFSNPSSLSYGFVAPGTTSSSMSYTLTGTGITPASGNITITPPADFQVSIDGTTWVTSPNTLLVPYTGGALATTQIYVRAVNPASNTLPLNQSITNAWGTFSFAVAVSATSDLFGSYCESGATNEYDQDIGNVTITNPVTTAVLLNNGVASPLYSNSTATALYTNYGTTVPAIQLVAGDSYNMSVSIVNRGTYAYPCSLKVYIDYNRNGQFDLPNELAWGAYTGSGNTLTDDTHSSIFTIPANADLLGTTRMRIVAAEYNDALPCGTYSYGETEDYLVQFLPPPPMVYLSATATQPITVAAPTPSSDNVILNTQIVTQNAGTPLHVSSITFNNAGTTLISDIANAKLWFTGVSNSPAGATQIGAPIVTFAPNGDIVFSGIDVELLNGTNNFWLSYDIADISEYAGGRFVDATLVGFSIGSTPYLVAVAPEGNREIKSPMIGTYIVGAIPTAAFQSLSSAVTELNILGMKGNVNFAIASDLTETAPVDIFEWDEVGTGDYSLNIYPTGAARTITGPANYGEGFIQLMNVSRVNIDGRIDMTGTSKSLTIRNTSEENEYYTLLVNSSNLVNVRYCNIENTESDGNYSVDMIVLGNSANLNISNNNMNNSFFGLYVAGNDETTGAVSNINVENNIFGSSIETERILYSALIFINTTNAVAKNNEILNIIQGSTFDAVSVRAGVTNSIFELNKIHGLVNNSTNRAAAFGISASANAGLTFANNIIYDVNGNGTGGASYPAAGFYLESGTGINIYHNTVYLTGDRSMASGTSSSVSAPSGCVVINSADVAGLDIRNNIFINNLTMSNTGSSAKNYAIYTSGTSAQFTNINSNLYYANGTASYLGYVSSADRITLTDLQTGFGQNVNSNNEEITFKSATDLHLDGASALDEDLLCEPIAIVTTDMDGITRRTAAGQAQMGADEVMPTIAFTQDLVNTDNFYCITNPPTEELLQVQAQLNGYADGIVRSSIPTFDYTWMENGVVIEDATENTYNLLIENENRLGNIYQAVVTSFLNTLTSTAKTIRVEGAINIVTNPVESQLLCTDRGYIDIFARAAGTIDSYGWEKYNTTTHDWTLLSGMIGETLRVELENPLMGAGQYRMLVRGPGHCGAANIYSGVSNITVVEPVSNVVINANGTVSEENSFNYCVENDVVLTADVESIDGLITGYFWQIKNGNEWSDIDVNVYPTANTPILELLNAKVEESGIYRLRVTGSDVCNILETVSNEINVIVYPYVKVLNSPEGQVVCREEQVMLSVKAEGANQIFQWQKDGQDILVTDNATADKPVFVINSADFDHSGVYRCKIQLDGCISAEDGGGDGYLYTKSALVYVMSNTRIVTQPASVYANIGGQTSLEVKAHATGAPQDYMAEYQWYRGTEPLIDGTKFSGTRTSVLTIKDVETSDIRNDYSVVVIGKCGAPVRSDDASVKQVNFMITTQPVGQTECEGNTATFSVEATSNVENTTIKYEWYFIDNSNNKILLTETSNTLQVDANEQNVGSYYATVTLLPMNVVENSHAVALTVNKKAEIITQPQSAAITEGAQFTLTVDAVSSLVLDYQWYRNGVEISGARQETYSSTEANAGTFIYTVVISNDCGDVTSLPATISVTASGSMNVNEIVGLQVSEVSPNPVNGSAAITLNTNATSNTTVNVIDASGRTVMNLFDGLLSGKQDVKIDATNLSSGIYFISITMNGQTITRQLVVSK